MSEEKGSKAIGEAVCIAAVAAVNKYKNSATFLSQFMDPSVDGLEKMAAYRQYHPELAEREYVVGGSIVGCSLGTELSRLDLPTDHGVYDRKGNPVMVCSDCKAGVNVYSFGMCKSLRRLDLDKRCRVAITGEWKEAGDVHTHIWSESEKCYKKVLTIDGFQVCLHGHGLITIREVNGNPAVVEGSGQLVTQAQVNSFTWNGQYFGYHNSFDVATFNDYLSENNVTDYKSIAMFMATIGAESDMGRIIEEGGDDAYWEGRGYNRQTKGAGLIQLTGKFDKANSQIMKDTAQDDFMNYIVNRGDYKTPLTLNNPSKYIADNYPVESAVIYWSVKAIKNALGDSINDGIVKRLQTVQGTTAHSVEDRIFLFSQYVVNGYIRLRNVSETTYNGIDISTDKLMREILYEGADYKIYSPNNKEDEYKIEFLTGNYVGYVTNGPDIWNKRKEMYGTAKGIWN